LIKNKKNVGFSKAVNQGIKQTKNEIIFLINPDCYLENNSIIKSIQLICEDNTIGAIGGKLKKPLVDEYHPTANTKAGFLTGLFEFTNLKNLFPKNTYSKYFWIETIKNNKRPFPVESLCGAYIIFRKKLNGKLNLFDEDYFMYLEDMAFGNQINSLGYKVIFDPRSEVTHIGGASTNSKYRTVLPYWYNSRKIYFNKHLPKIQSTILICIFSIEEIILKIFHIITQTPNA
jgi:GT2 family glycosyltransferase